MVRASGRIPEDGVAGGIPHSTIARSIVVDNDADPAHRLHNCGVESPPVRLQRFQGAAVAGADRPISNWRDPHCWNSKLLHPVVFSTGIACYGGNSAVDS